MLRILIMFLILCVGSIGKTEDPAISIKSLIKEYDSIKDPAERFIIATLIRLRIPTDKEKLALLNLSNLELQGVRRAENEINSLTELAKDLEAKLTPADITLITKDNPASIYRTINKFRIANPHADCTPAKYEELKKKVDLPELYSRGQYIGAYLTASESPFQKVYVQHLSNLIAKDSRFVAYRPLVNTLLSERTSAEIMKRSGLSALTSAFSDPDHARLKRYEENLIKEGVPATEVRQYAAKLALLSPECLSVISIPFIKSSKRDFAVAKVAKFAERIKGARLTLDDIPYGITKFVDQKDPYLRSDKDPWGGFVEISKVGPNSIQLVSQGDDRISSSDDIRSKPIPVQLDEKKTSL